MGQYFQLINESKKQYVCCYCLDGLAKWYEWVFNDTFKLLGLLIRKSDDSGGGDLDFDEKHANIVGSWAGDKISLVGDYDSSGLYDIAREQYKNISEELIEAWNDSIDSDQYKLNFTPCNDCPKSDKFQKMLKKYKFGYDEYNNDYKQFLWDLRKKLNKYYITEKDIKENRNPKVKIQRWTIST